MRHWFCIGIFICVATIKKPAAETSATGRISKIRGTTHIRINLCALRGAVTPSALTQPYDDAYSTTFGTAAPRRPSSPPSRTLTPGRVLSLHRVWAYYSSSTLFGFIIIFHEDFVKVGTFLKSCKSKLCTATYLKMIIYYDEKQFFHVSLPKPTLSFVIIYITIIPVSYRKEI